MFQYAEYKCSANLNIIASFASWLSSAAEDSASVLIDPYTYHPTLRPLYNQFLETLHSICSPFTKDPYELAYIAAARWPGFVKPVLDAYKREVKEFQASARERPVQDPPELLLPREDVRIRLMRLFTPSFTAALESLYPRLENATQWAHTHAPPDDLLDLEPSQIHILMRAMGASGTDSSEFTDASIEDLPRMSRFILVAAFLASTNPPKSDLRMFGRGLDERAKSRRRKGGGFRKPKPGATGGSVKVIHIFDLLHGSYIDKIFSRSPNAC